MESGTDLEMLFLELTGGQALGEGSFVGLSANGNGGPRPRQERKPRHEALLLRLRKLVRRPATWVTVGLLIGLLTLIVSRGGRDGKLRAGARGGNGRGWQRRQRQAPDHVPGRLRPDPAVP